ncbi:MAG TPA: sigma-70 family RNA polymerase sigma factor [Gemmatimonadaceae bacterium]|nr:sigma-70 family RNA polymerase sigma factor [Gemmatimonadaceae bacterium]
MTALALPSPLYDLPTAAGRRVAPVTPPTSVSGPVRDEGAELERLRRRREEERALVLAAQAGSEPAFASLVRLHQQRAYAVARAIAATHEDAEDAVQDGFLHAYRALDRFRPDQPFGAWLHRIVANAALDLARRRKVRAAEELPDTVASPFRDPAEASDLRSRLGAALARLGERQRAVIVLHDVEGFKHAEIGLLLGIPEGTARSDLHHARAQLRRALGDVRSDL